MSKMNVMIKEDEIKARLAEIGAEISKDYKGCEELVLICVLKGSVYITCELSRHIDVPVVLDFMSVSSYGNETESSGRVRILKDLDDSIDGKDVIIIEDIIDSGRTLSYLYEMLKSRNPKSLKICTLLDKPDRRIPESTITVDYTGFVIPDKFVVGYGLDDCQKLRNLPYIGVIE
ncbi:MAG: hypoxanthine phosphoribosyltransferase [Lachnospiraceae bacterium]|nr:hypoxanthine phosphoribosyltransferase [Lachnospiraceae bacterium]